MALSLNRRITERNTAAGIANNGEAYNESSSEMMKEKEMIK